MLEICFVLDPVATRLGVACELRILLVDLRRCSTDLDVRAIALERAVAMVVVVSTTATAAPATAGLSPAPTLTLHETFLIFRVLAPIGRELGRYLADQPDAWL
jgi:hypothetical protein